MKERDDWLNSPALDCGRQLFGLIEQRIMQELPAIRGIAARERQRERQRQRQRERQRRMLGRSDVSPQGEAGEGGGGGEGKAARGAFSYLRDQLQAGLDFALLRLYHSQHNLTQPQPLTLTRPHIRSRSSSSRALGDAAPAPVSAAEPTSGSTSTSGGGGGTYLSLSDSEEEHQTYDEPFETDPGTDTAAAAAADKSQQQPGPHRKIYVYIASDNEVVKEAMVHYLKDHADIAVMRVHNNAEIAHAKNLHYLKSVGNHTGIMDLAVDWYGLSLANVVFAWRRNTNFISTFAHSAQRMSGNNERSDHAAGIGHGIGSRGLSLYFGKSGQPVWRYFY
jgi:hypothetical protein